jgi:hypothetical protein
MEGVMSKAKAEEYFNDFCECNCGGSPHEKNCNLLNPSVTPEDLREMNERFRKFAQGDKAK